MKSSTTKGPQGLASQFNERRCQTVKTQRRRVGERFYVRFPEIMSRKAHGNYGVREDVHTTMVSLGRRPDSDVTRWTKTMTNAGRSVATGVVAGAWLGRPGISNATDWECGSSRK